MADKIEDKQGRKDRIRKAARDKAFKKVACYKRLFTSPDGVVVLKDLRDAFEQKLNVPGDPFASHVRIGNFEVLQYIREIMEVEENVG